MSTIGILQIYDVIARNKEQYCCICFRAAAERKLVEPVHLKNFLSKLARCGDFKGEIHVCYICEALALSAARFVRNVELASKVRELFTNMDQQKWAKIYKSLRAPNNVSKVINKQCIAYRAQQLENSLRSSSRYDLHRTDILVVPSPPRPREDMTEMQHNQVIPTVMPSLTPVMPVMTPARGPQLPTKISVDPELKVVRVMNRDTQEIILHPMVQGLDGNVYVPSLQLQILDNGSLISAPKDVIPNLIPAVLTPVQNDSKLKNISQNEKNPEKSKETSDYYNFLVSQMEEKQSQNANVKSAPTIPNVTPSALPTQNNSKLKNTMQKEKNTEKSKETSEYYKFIVSQMEQKQSQNANVEVIKMNDLNIVLNTDDGAKNKRKRKGSSEKTLKEVQILLNENAQGSCNIEYEIIDAEDDKEIQDPLAIKEVLTSKEPVETTDRTVDWEDKIPMDVISFMDATDPNPEERIMQPPPMGFISDVRSVPNEPVECIDLC